MELLIRITPNDTDLGKQVRILTNTDDKVKALIAAYSNDNDLGAEIRKLYI